MASSSDEEVILPVKNVKSREKRTIKPNPRFDEKPTTSKGRIIKKPATTAPTSKTPTNPATTIEKHKGQRCTMQEYRTALMRKDKKELRYEIDCLEMSEDNTVDMNEFLNYLHQKMNAADIVINRKEWNITVESKAFMKKSDLRKMVKLFLTKNKLNQSVHVVPDGKDSLKLQYFRLPSE